MKPEVVSWGGEKEIFLTKPEEEGEGRTKVRKRRWKERRDQGLMSKRGFSTMCA